VKTISIVTMVATLATLAIQIAVAAKLQVAKEDAEEAWMKFAASPFKMIGNILKNGG
jgi:hypothetical protein